MRHEGDNPRWKIDRSHKHLPIATKEQTLLDSDGKINTKVTQQW